MKRMGVLKAVVAAGLVAAPALVWAQMNPNPGPVNPQSPQNQNIPLNQPSYPTQTGGTQANQTSSMRDSLGAPGQTGQQMQDRRFVRTATQEGIANIKLSELALQKGSPAIKQLAQTMLDDHTAINKDLVDIADSLDILVPRKMSREQQAEYDKLNKLSGKDFDTEYINFMSHSHFQDLHAFYSEANSTDDTTLQQQVLTGLRTLHDHLGLIRDTAKQENIPLPPPPPRGQLRNPASASR